jgi:hypothetical protein
MTLKRLLLVACLMGLLGTAAFVAREAEGPGPKMTGAAEKFLAGLTDAQKKAATFDFDDKERLRYFFTPQQAKGKATRNGLPLAEMNEKQKALAHALLLAGTSEAGYKKATTIMSLESILAELETKGRIVRDPTWYFFSVFGTPSKTGKWGWRVEGHHLSLNFTLDGGKIVSATPFVMCANPAEVKGGKHKGTVALPESLAPYKDLVAALDDEQRKAARQEKLHSDVEENKPKPTVGEPVGLKAAKMNDKQKGLLWKLIEGYARRMPEAIAAEELAAVKKAGLDDVHFAYAVDEKRKGQPFSYRVQGPTFVIEFINEQNDSAGNPANHIHSAWRNVNGDFGLATR